MTNYPCFEAVRERSYADLRYLVGLRSPKLKEVYAAPELKALFPTPRDAVDYILDQFPIVRRKDEERFGEYRTKRVILEIYDAMAEARRTGRPWTSGHHEEGGSHARQ